MYPEYRARLKTLPVAVFTSPDDPPASPPAAPAGRRGAPPRRPARSRRGSRRAQHRRDGGNRMMTKRALVNVSALVAVAVGRRVGGAGGAAADSDGPADAVSAEAGLGEAGGRNPARAGTGAPHCRGGREHRRAGGRRWRAARRHRLRADERQGAGGAPHAVEPDASHHHQHDPDGLPHRRQRRADQGGPPQPGRSRPRAAAERSGPDRHVEAAGADDRHRPRQDPGRALAAKCLQRQAEGSVVQRRARGHPGSAQCRDGGRQHRLVQEVRRARRRARFSITPASPTSTWRRADRSTGSSRG